MKSHKRVIRTINELCGCAGAWKASQWRVEHNALPPVLIGDNSRGNARTICLLRSSSQPPPAAPTVASAAHSAKQILLDHVTRFMYEEISYIVVFESRCGLPRRAL